MTVIATAGHVDHGKSTLITALTGTDPDRFAEEKRRGLTIDLGFAQAKLPSGRQISFVDVPGHSRYLRNMLAGVGAVNACLFVVDASEGWRAQSEEHLRIVDLLGVAGGVIALTKVDRVDDETVEIAQLEVAERVAGTVLAEAPMVAVSAQTGQGLDELRAVLDSYLESAAPPRDRRRARLWVDRSFAATGSGTIVTGTLEGGVVATGDRVVIHPAGHEARIRAVQSHGAQLDRVGPGTRVALNLTGVGHDEVGRGDVVVHPDRWHLTNRLDTSLSVLAGLDHDVSRRGAYIAYVGSGTFPAQLRVLGVEQIAAGTTGAVRLHLDVVLPLLPGDRFILRETGRDETVGGGEILDVAPVLPAAAAAPDRDWQRVVAERGWITADELERLTGESVDPVVGPWIAEAAVVDAVTDDLRRRVEQAGGAGLPLGELDERERAVVAQLDDLIVDATTVRSAEAGDPLADHPVIAQLSAGGLAPPAPDTDRTVLRQLQQRGLLFERDGVWFHCDAVDHAARLVVDLLAENPEGFTVAQFRDVAGVTRKFALPLLGELDARGMTRRRDDVRIAGRRLDPMADAEPPPRQD